MPWIRRRSETEVMPMTPIPYPRAGALLPPAAEAKVAKDEPRLSLRKSVCGWRAERCGWRSETPSGELTVVKERTSSPRTDCD